VLLVASVVVAGVALGYAFGGRARNLETLRLRWWGLAPVGLVMQLAPTPVEGHGGHLLALSLLLASYVVLLAFAAKNLRLAGFPLIAAGLVLNGLVISLNGGMPVTEGALRASGQGGLLHDLVLHGGAKHHLAHDETFLFLGDVIPVPQPIGQVVSAGDVLVYAGMLWLLVAAMRRRPEAPAPAGSIVEGVEGASPPVEPGSRRPPPSATLGRTEP
jgi:hypothetical protein